MYAPFGEGVGPGRGEAVIAVRFEKVAAFGQAPYLVTPPLRLPVATALNDQLPASNTHTTHTHVRN